MNVLAYPTVCIIRNTWYIRAHTPAANEIMSTLILLWSICILYVWNMFHVTQMVTHLAGVFSLVKMTVMLMFMVMLWNMDIL